MDIKKRKSAVLIATKGDSRRERAGGKVVRRVRVAKGREDMAAMKGCRGRCVTQRNGVEKVLRKGDEGKVTEKTCQGGVKVMSGVRSVANEKEEQEMRRARGGGGTEEKERTRKRMRSSRNRGEDEEEEEEYQDENEMQEKQKQVKLKKERKEKRRERSKIKRSKRRKKRNKGEK